MKHRYLLFLAAIFFVSSYVSAEKIEYAGSWGEEGISITTQSSQKIVLNYSIRSFSFTNVNINGEEMTELSLPGVLLPNDKGAPNLPGMGRYIALPEGAVASLKVIDQRIETIKDISVAPAPRIPWDTERGPLEYEKDQQIYSKNAFYPSKPVKLSEKTEIRGLDAVMMGITPFQYNPVTRELLVYRDIKIEVTFEGGNGEFGEDRLRSRWWDPIIRNTFVNEASIPDISYNRSYQQTKETGCEYLIVVPNNPEFKSWGDSIKNFRTLQGIESDVITLDEIGGNTVNTLEGFFNDAYNTWDIVPAAVLLLGDYGTNANNSIISPIWDYYCVSDNIYADVNNNDMPDIIFARITAQNETQLETMVSKFLNYERTPPVNENFYNHPITALGWQTERWFQICSESVGGFWKNELGKDPVRINEIYGGNPNSDPWSTATNTYTVLNIFGPDGLGYIPESPSDLGNWNGGNANDINAAINNGSFMLQHRDHGYELGWGEPAYSSGNINALSNTDLTFVFSVNCLTGKYNLSGECFTEKFHRHTSGGQNAGALGLIAASEVSYSFVNDVYVWGMYDNLWPEFFPQFGSSVDYRGILPAFGNAAGKYFLKQSNWPYNTGNKEVTYNLFHHHGDAFLTVYSEMPQDLTVIHNNELITGQTSFSVWANEGSLIALTVDGEIIGTAESEGDPVNIEIPVQAAGDQMIVTVTKQNYYRYQTGVDVIDANTAYIAQLEIELDDATGNGNGLLDYGESVTLNVTLENLGLVTANNVTVSISTEHPDITITDDSEVFGDFAGGASVTVEDAFAFETSFSIPDMDMVLFTIEATDGSTVWTSEFAFVSHAPVLAYADYTIDDPTGNNNGRIDPGETVDVMVSIFNGGSSQANNVTGELSCEHPDVAVSSGVQTYGSLLPDETVDQPFIVEVSTAIEEGTQITFTFDFTGEGGFSGSAEFSLVAGKYTALVLDLDPMNHSGPGILETFGDMDIFADYKTGFPDDLGLYKNVFICLGLHFTNYELDWGEGIQLKNYLEDGGNLYMEGRVTWKEDIQTPVHSMFNIEVIDYPMYLIEEVVGSPGPLTGAMTFVYEGDNPVNNYSIEPMAPAFSLFTTQDPEHGCMVAYNEGTYHTIGSTIEFGKLVDGESPSTKTELMHNMLEWFDGLITSDDESYDILNNQTFAIAPNPFRNETKINIHVEKQTEVDVTVYNLQGKMVRSLLKEQLVDNSLSVSWNGEDDQGNVLPPGMYYCTLRYGSTLETVKLVLTK